MGATGSGKSHLPKTQWIPKWPGPVVVWDYKHEYHNLPAVSRIRDLAQQLTTARRLRFTTDHRDPVTEFNKVCELLWIVQQWRPRTPLLFVAEELHEVTPSPSAPVPQWRRIQNVGRAFGFTVVGITTRPALVDKSFTGNATLIRCGRLGELRDANVLAGKLRVPADDLMRLADRHAYEWKAGGHSAQLVGPDFKPISA